jgi:hypothetical protein
MRSGDVVCFVWDAWFMGLTVSVEGLAVGADDSGFGKMAKYG